MPQKTKDTEWEFGQLKAWAIRNDGPEDSSRNRKLWALLCLWCSGHYTQVRRFKMLQIHPLDCKSIHRHHGAPAPYTPNRRWNSSLYF